MYLAHLEKLSRIRLADVLVEEGVLERDKVEEAQAEQESTGRQLGDILAEREILTEYDLAKLIATHWTLPYLDVTGYQVKREVVARLPMDFCEKHCLLPLDEFGSMLTIAVTEMPDQELVQSIASQTNLTPCLFVALRRGIQNALAEEKKRSAKSAANTRPGTSSGTPLPPAPQAPPAVAPPVASGGKADLPLPEFDLPTVSMKLVGATAQKVATTPQRVSAVKEAPVAAKPGGALGWMDAASKGAAQGAQSSNQRISKFGTPALKPEEAQKTEPLPGSGAKPSGGGAWQTIFDAAEESVKKPK